MRQGLELGGMFTMYINGVYIAQFKNAIVDEGLNAILDTHLKETGVRRLWYMGLVGTGALANADTLASHSWTEVTAYTGSRKAVVCGSAASQIIQTSGTCDFTINDSTEIFGAFICSVAAGTSGILWSTGLLDGGSVVVVDTNVVSLNYKLTASRAV